MLLQRTATVKSIEDSCLEPLSHNDGIVFSFDVSFEIINNTGIFSFLPNLRVRISESSELCLKMKFFMLAVKMASFVMSSFSALNCKIFKIES